MKVICGVVDKNGARHIFSAESTPTLEEIETLAARAAIGSYDWGAEATENASQWTARIILSSVIDPDETLRMASAYADEVVRGKMSTDRMWILSIEEIELWLKAHRQLV